MFKPVSSRLNIQQEEEARLRFWRAHEVFKKSSDERKDREPFVMFEGPPTANGKPGVHHVLARAIKDMFPRFRTMQGYFVDRRGGWDTHGLPVEIEVEKKLGFTEKSEIEAYGIEKFNALCRESAFSRIQDWEKMTERIAYWVDLSRSYITYTNPYIESVWWHLRQIWDKGLLYQGYKVVPYCPRCGTPLSNHEVAQGYADAVDPSITVRLPLVDEPNTYLLVWTTTPWTLPGNVAVAAHPDVEYVMVRVEGEADERMILAKELIPAVFGDRKVEVLKTMKGKALEGKKYAPLYSFIPPDKPAHYVVNAEYVTTSDGTGLVHIAPAFGMDDMQVAKLYDLPVLLTIDNEGKFDPAVKPWAGMFVKDADPLIMEDLKKRGLLINRGTITHTYPFCWRCDTPLLYMARSTWFIRTSSVKERMVALNQKINWVPEHIKEGRFGNWLENNVDWALGRDRYWGTPLPVWVCESCGHQHCVGSVKELSELTGQDQSKLELHRPYVDNVHFNCPKCGGGKMSRVSELIDVWFDSGAMPAAQWNYPFENQDKFKQQFPADFICEAVDQTRGWFYSLLAISTLVFDNLSYENVICLGLILDAEGQKMSKHKGNVVDPWEVIDAYGADAMRWYLYTSSPPGNERRFSTELVGEVVRSFMLTLWNTYSFFVTYANLDHWTPDSSAIPQFSDLDRWLLSSLEALVRDVTKAYETYDVVGATRPIEAFVDNLSNWYLRRSRRRFWKSESDADKAAAYETLYRALVTVSKLLAPSMPFIAETLYQNLVRSDDDLAPISVHLAQWPQADLDRIDETLNHQMAVVMKLASLGHAARNKSNVKVRQPLSEIAFAVGSADELDVVEKFRDILEDELNVKRVRVLGGSEEAVDYSLNPLPRQLGQKYKGLSPKVRQAILELPAKESAERLLAGLNLVVKIDDKYYEILPEEVEVHAAAKEGFSVATEGPYMAALVTTISQELFYEGLSREFVRRVQDQRKSLGLDIADRIRIYYQATPALSEAVKQNEAYIAAETLAVAVLDSPLPQGLTQADDSFDGEDLQFAIQIARGAAE
jgi:isoleucyl-tRNA synthetase